MKDPYTIETGTGKTTVRFFFLECTAKGGAGNSVLNNIWKGFCERRGVLGAN